MMSAFSSRVGGRFVQEWNANPRLRLGGYVIAALLAIYLVFVLNDWRKALHEQYQQRTLQLYKMAALSGQEHWLARAEQARTLRKALEAQIPSAASVGLAQAEVQTSVQDLLRAFGQGLSVETSPAAQLAERPGIWRLPVVLRGPLSATQLIEILRRIESGDRLVLVEQIAFDNQQRPNATLTTVAYYRIATTEKSDAGP